ncbi:hypothetical protein E1180_09270 [Roseibium denhamense]|uniref:Uncharacterized protein n=1 Tax=Roseibium denhamense TaxID=76305 RepID=A0ABY1PQ03_9HYPH|nr:hypothetical protein [Roseibium denhamense]MTI05705.1 hypothetical protein [Roseibium denhamense]SMP36919.1 hypothetical protein SAMN06265374_4373 [Roseibium denhamense]
MSLDANVTARPRAKPCAASGTEKRSASGRRVEHLLVFRDFAGTLFHLASAINVPEARPVRETRT